MELHKDESFLREKYVIEGLSSRDLGKLCGVDQKTILNRLANFNLPIRSVQESRKEWFKHHPHPILGKGIGKKASSRKCYQKHRARRIAECKQYRKDHREAYLAKSKEYYQKNRERILEQTRKSARKLRMEVLCHYGGNPPACACCGDSHIEFLSIDHINGNGTQHRKKIGIAGGSSFYCWLRKNNYPEGFRMLCCNCNASFGYYGYCPHEQKEL